MNKEVINNVHCPSGHRNIPQSDLTIFQHLGDLLIMKKVGVCDRCKKGWTERIPGVKNITPLEVVAIESNSKKHTVTVVSCNNALQPRGNNSED